MKRTRAYLVVMSKGDPIPIDHEELALVVSAFNNRTVAIVKQGIVNTSFMVTVIPDKQRLQEYRDAIRRRDPEVIKHGIPSLPDVMGIPEIRGQLQDEQPRLYG